MKRALESVDYTVLLGVDGVDGLEVFRQTTSVVRRETGFDSHGGPLE